MTAMTLKNKIEDTHNIIFSNTLAKEAGDRTTTRAVDYNGTHNVYNKNKNSHTLI